MKFDWHTLCISHAALLREAVEKLDNQQHKIVFVVDNYRTLLGTITDGDVRRGILKGYTLNDSVSLVMNSSPTKLIESCIDINVLTKLKQKKIKFLPIVDQHNRIINLELLPEFHQPTSYDNPVVLMAGGMATRLRPLTKTIPKALLQIGGKPILEIIIERLAQCGFNNLYISINYLGDQIKTYFGSGAKWNVNINYIEEEMRLGTAGPLGLLPAHGSEPILIMNADILTKIDFEQLLLFHVESHAYGTAGVRDYQLDFPYGIFEIEENRIRKIVEKPTYQFFLNAGVYVLNEGALSYIKKNEYLDMPDLLKILIENREIISAFPIREYWLDIGQMKEFEQAHSDYEVHFL